MTLNHLILSKRYRKSIFSFNDLAKEESTKKLESFFHFLYQAYYLNKYRYKQRYLKKYRRKRSKFVLTILRFKRFFFNHFICALDSIFKKKSMSIHMESFFYPFLLLCQISNGFSIRKSIRKYFLRCYGKRLDLFSVFRFRSIGNYFNMIGTIPTEGYLFSFLPKEKLLAYLLLLDRFFYKKSFNNFSSITFQGNNLFSRILGNFNLFRSPFLSNALNFNSSFYYFIYNIVKNNFFYCNSVLRDISLENNKLAYLFFLKQSLSFNFSSAFLKSPVKILRNTNAILIYTKFISGEWKKHLFAHSFKQFFFQLKLNREIGLLFLKNLYVIKRAYEKFLILKRKRRHRKFYTVHGKKYLKSRIYLMKIYFLAYLYLSSKGNFVLISKEEREQSLRDEIRWFRKRRRWRTKFYKRMSRLRVKRIDFKKLKNISFKEYYDTYINPRSPVHFKNKSIVHSKNKDNTYSKYKSNSSSTNSINRRTNRFQSVVN